MLPEQEQKQINMEEIQRLYNHKEKMKVMILYLFLSILSWSSLFVLLWMMTLGYLDLTRRWNYVMMVFFLFFAMGSSGSMTTSKKTILNNGEQK